jgi:hypothetical protein
MRKSATGFHGVIEHIQQNDYVVVWLRSLGLGKYEAIFRDNDIDETVLPNLIAEDLKELGVASLGHRRKLLDAIAALRDDGSGKAPPLTRRPRRVPQAYLPKTGVLGPCGLYGALGLFAYAECLTARRSGRDDHAPRSRS